MSNPKYVFVSDKV